MIQGFMAPLLKTLYTVSMSLQTFLFLSAVSCPVYFTDLLSSPLTLSSFSGSVVIVYRTSITNASGTQDPTWECFIDNISIGWSLASATVIGIESNNWILCVGGQGQFQDGPHLLTVNANVSNQQTFWFDQTRIRTSKFSMLHLPASH